MKAPEKQKTITKQVSKRLESLRPYQQQAQGISSWINYVRQGLGMGLTQLAQRVGVAQPSLSSSIKLEAEGRITIQKLRQIADALECDLIYAFVPRKKIEEIIHDQAIMKTKALMLESETHMSLENQKVQGDMQERLEELAEERMYSKYLWDK